MAKPTNIKTLHKPALDIATAESVDRIQCDDLRFLDGAVLYAIVMKHWQKCEPCAQAALVSNSCKAVSVAAKFMASLHDKDLTAVA